ncbi:hypothetical protein KNH48_10945 [Heyndrickxia coagulans]|nr:hypothetical protein KNH48_10945 [Heyndrickxia coagulans]
MASSGISLFRVFGYLGVLDLPVINGLVVGSICAALGHRIESLCDKHVKKQFFLAFHNTGQEQKELK